MKLNFKRLWKRHIVFISLTIRISSYHTVEFVINVNNQKQYFTQKKTLIKIFGTVLKLWNSIHSIKNSLRVALASVTTTKIAPSVSLLVLVSITPAYVNSCVPMSERQMNFTWQVSTCRSTHTPTRFFLTCETMH